MFIHTCLYVYSYWFSQFIAYLSFYSSSGSTRCCVSVGNFLVSFTHLLKSLSNCLVTALFLICPLFGMLFLMRIHAYSSTASFKWLKSTFTARHTHLSLNYPLTFFVVLDLFSAVLPQKARDRGEIKCYISSIGVEIRRLSSFAYF